MRTTMSKEQTIINYEDYFSKAVSYDSYRENFQHELSIGEQSPFASYLPQNWQRQSRLDRKLKLTEDLLAVIENIKNPQNWLVITEHWCGDASQINPIISKVAEASKGKINLRFIYRDENPALMAAHLTDGRSKSIPILLQLDEQYNFLASCGPRPEEAQKLVLSILGEGGDYNIPLHTWYAKDKQKAIQEDLQRLLTMYPIDGY